MSKVDLDEVLDFLLNGEEKVKTSWGSEYPISDYIKDVIKDGYADGQVETEAYGTIKFECVVSEGGGEGSGEYVERVEKFTVQGEELYVKETGSYYSYHGTDWDGDYTRVYPREVMITEYFDSEEE